MSLLSNGSSGGASAARTATAFCFGRAATARAIDSNLSSLRDIQKILPNATENPVVRLLVARWRQIYFYTNGQADIFVTPTARRGRVHCATSLDRFHFGSLWRFGSCFLWPCRFRWRSMSG